MNRKRSSEEQASSASKQPRRQVKHDTFLKWQRNYEKDHQSLAWLRADRDTNDKSLVSTLWCAMCRKYESQISGQRNFSRAWIEGSVNHKTSNIIDHATSDQHKSAMTIHHRDQARDRNEPITSYSPIARGLLSPAMDPVVRERVKKKFEISFVLAKEHIPFSKYPAIHELEEKHAVDLGIAYKNRDSPRNFVHYIAESQRQAFQHGDLSSIFLLSTFTAF